MDDFPNKKNAQRASEPVAHFEVRLASPIDRLAANVADFVIFFPLLALVTAVFSRYAKEAQLESAENELEMRHPDFSFQKFIH